MKNLEEIEVVDLNDLELIENNGGGIIADFVYAWKCGCGGKNDESYYTGYEHTFTA